MHSCALFFEYKERFARVDLAHFQPDPVTVHSSETSYAIHACAKLITAYDRNSHEVDKFGLESSDGRFQLDGKVIDYLFYVFEARTSHQAYAITRSQARHEEFLDDDAESRQAN